MGGDENPERAEAAPAPAARRRRTQAGLLALAGLPLALLAAALLVAWTDPVGLFRLWNRLALGRAGLRRASLPAPRGPLVYWEGGTGPALLLLHGMGNDAGIWARTVPALLPGHRLLVPDLPGHGASAPPTGPLALADLVRGVEALVAARAPRERVILVGNSLGGWVALRYALAHPGKVSRLVLVSSAGLSTRLGVRFLVRDRREAGRLVDALTGPAAPRLPGFVLDDVADKMQHGPSPRLFRSLSRADLLDRDLARIATPADLLWGTADELLPPAYGERLARGLPAARLHLLPGCGHAPQAECPDRFDELLLWVLREPPPAPVVEVRAPPELPAGPIR